MSLGRRLKHSFHKLGRKLTHGAKLGRKIIHKGAMLAHKASEMGIPYAAQLSTALDGLDQLSGNLNKKKIMNYAKTHSNEVLKGLQDGRSIKEIAHQKQQDLLRDYKAAKDHVKGSMIEKHSS